jgi:ribosomal protein L11 methyltransferase
VSWRLLEATMHGSDVDLATGLLWEHEPEAIHEEVHGVTVTLRATFSSSDDLEAASRTLHSVAWDHPVAVRTVELDDTVVRAAADGWRAHATVVRAGERIVVVPAWLPRPDIPGDGDLLVRIDPGLSFGSGSHPTTRLMLAAVERHVTNACSVLDVGTGSGVLAVAASLLGAGRVRAVDVDSEAVVAARANVEVNEATVDVDATPVDRIGGRFDLVLANMLAPVLVEVADSLVARTGGLLLVSGVLSGRWAHVADALAPLEVRETVSLDGWDQVTFARPGHRPHR